MCSRISGSNFEYQDRSLITHRRQRGSKEADLQMSRKLTDTHQVNDGDWFRCYALKWQDVVVDKSSNDSVCFSDQRLRDAASQQLVAQRFLRLQ